MTGHLLPNKTAAIAASNAAAGNHTSNLPLLVISRPCLTDCVCSLRAAAYLKLEGKAEEALVCALRAVAYCPEYPKAHHRVVSAVKAGARGEFTISDPRGKNKTQHHVRDNLATCREIQKAKAEGLAAVLPPAPQGSQDEKRRQEFQEMLDALPADYDADAEVERLEGLQVEMDNGLFSSEMILQHLQDQAKEIEQFSGLLPSLELGLFSAGRISYPALQARLRWKERAYLERDKPGMLSVSFSLVPSNVSGLEGENRGGARSGTFLDTCCGLFSAFAICLTHHFRSNDACSAWPVADHVDEMDQ